MNLIEAGRTLEEVLRMALLLPLEMRLLLERTLALTRVQLITQSHRMLTQAEAHALSQLVTRRLAGEPVAYLLGEREFFGLPFKVEPSVLIPRPETELLVELALDRLPSAGRLLDMGTGSGAIAVAIAYTRPDSVVHALDVCPAALATARDNAQRNDATVHFLQSDWFAALEDDAVFDLIVSNPPYIVADDRHLAEGDLRFEPVGALTDHGDGLSAIGILCQQTPAHLSVGGWLLMEHGYDQASTVRALLAQSGFEAIESWRDLAGIERVSGGCLAPR